MATWVERRTEEKNMHSQARDVICCLEGIVRQVIHGQAGPLSCAFEGIDGLSRQDNDAYAHLIFRFRFFHGVFLQLRESTAQCRNASPFANIAFCIRTS